MQMKVYSLVKVPERKKVIKSTVSEQDFQGAQLTYLTGREIFERCFHKGTNTFIIPEGFVHITEHGLDTYKADMERLVIPKSLVSIEADALKYCMKLKVIEVHRDNPVYTVVNGTLCKRNTCEQVWTPPGRIQSNSVKERKQKNMWLRERMKIPKEHVNENEKLRQEIACLRERVRALEDYIREQGLSLPLK